MGGRHGKRQAGTSSRPRSSGAHAPHLHQVDGLRRWRARGDGPVRAREPGDRGGRDDQGRLRQPADRTARRFRPDRSLYPDAGPQGAGARRDDRRQDIFRRDHRQGHAVGPGARRSARQGADRERQGRPDAGDLDPRSGQPGRRRLRGGGRAEPFDRHALGSFLFRTRRQARPAIPVQVELSLQLRRP